LFKSVIFYFSGTGNTWWAADRIKKQLDAKNINADIVSIDSVDPKKADWWIKASDLVFFGWPVYGSDMPEPMKLFIDNLLPVEKGKHIHTFCTQMAFSGDGAWFYHKNFEDKGLIIDSAYHFIMPSNVSVWRGPLGAPRSKDRIARIMARCEKRIDRYISRLLFGKYRIMGKHSYPLGILQRAPYRLFYKMFRDLVGVNKERCTKCGICASLCPSENITMPEFPEFKGKCSLCLRCYSFCPESAITYRGKSYDIKDGCRPYLVQDKRFKPSVLK
jgi:ferredoxin/flavodoxin